MDTWASASYLQAAIDRPKQSQHYFVYQSSTAKWAPMSPEASDMSTTIRVSQRTRTLVRDLARDDGVTMQETVELAVEVYRRQRLLKKTNAAYAAVRANPAASAELDEDVAAWDGMLDNGLVGL